jgi:mRNA interferase MazF
MIISSVRFSFGDIILLKFPFTNNKGFKKRPALVIRDTSDGDIIVCRITSKLYYSEFDFEVINWSECGLKLPSVIRLHKLASLDKKLVDIKIGVLNKELCLQLIEKFSELVV